MTFCPCGSNLAYEDCCGPVINGEPARTAEALMRSRYTAYTLRYLDHVERTHAPEIREDFNRAEAERMAEESDWKGLEIRHTTEDGDHAEVEYVIRLRRDNQNMIQVERSTFRREQGLWLYVGSVINPKGPQRLVNKVGRNDPCPCGSGKKAKKCCGVTTVLE